MNAIEDENGDITNTRNLKVLPNEVITTSATGGQKGTKAARFDLIPQGPLWELAELYGFGAVKYPDGNWRKGYEWSKSIAALQRHFSLWMQGEELDDGPGGSGLPHLTAVAWHAFTLREWARTHPEYDDRFKD